MDLKNFDELYPGRFLKAGLLEQPTTFTIRDIRREDIRREDDQEDKGPEMKVILQFTETPLELVLPKVSAICLREMFGPRVPEWIGKRVTLYATDKIMPHPKTRAACIRIYGSPDIAAPVTVKWTPPKRRELTQIMQPVQLAGTAPEPKRQQPPAYDHAAALAKVAAIGTAEALAAAEQRLADLASSGAITEEQSAELSAAILQREHELTAGVAA